MMGSWLHYGWAARDMGSRGHRRHRHIQLQPDHHAHHTQSLSQQHVTRESQIVDGTTTSITTVTAHMISEQRHDYTQTLHWHRNKSSTAITAARNTINAQTVKCA